MSDERTPTSGRYFEALAVIPLSLALGLTPLPATAASECLDKLRELILGLEYDFPVRSEPLERAFFDSRSKYRYYYDGKELVAYSGGYQALTLGNRIYKSYDGGHSWTFDKIFDSDELNEQFREADRMLANKFKSAECSRGALPDGTDVRIVEGVLSYAKGNRQTYRFYLNPRTGFMVRKDWIRETKGRVFPWATAYSLAPDYEFPDPERRQD